MKNFILEKEYLESYVIINLLIIIILTLSKLLIINYPNIENFSDFFDKQTKKKILIHIPYYKNNVIKTDTILTNHNFENIKKVLDKINSFKGFSQIDVVIDINKENDYVKKINKSNLKNLNIFVHTFDFTNEHPLRLTTKHRFDMKNKIKDYDWFAYIESDTTINNDTAEFLQNNLDNLYENNEKLYTIPRLVYDKSGKFFYSDITKKYEIIDSINGRAILPEQRFGGSWFYSKNIMIDWLKHKSFLDFDHPNLNGGIRVMMGIGFIEKIALIPINENNIPKISCIHLGNSGKYYKKIGKFNSLLLNDLCLKEKYYSNTIKR